MNKNGLIVIYGLITLLVVLFTLASSESEPTQNESFDEMDQCADPELTRFERDCCYQTQSIRRQCYNSHNPNECIIDLTPKWDVCDIE